MITNFKLFEKLGVVSNLSDIAKIIAKEMTTKDYYSLKMLYKNEAIEIECYHHNRLPGNDIATFSKIGDNLFKIQISGKDINIAEIIHELKHLDYFMERDYKL